ncbi:Serine/threonine-protein kinase AtPK1/AtPK6 [Acorus calamus]|uniref:non-specific serine/threonine protein kinase n=1 Tax=Acorus calamus TaxID=4465 RepID=A0AAV9ESL0_ACOCL|nr:Serine/threonine-protein kinase AtPK1/AtPK6 [Acorus calamus]
MVFKGRFFSSKKSDSSNSPDRSNSPNTPTSSGSPNRSEKKKVRSFKDDSPISSLRQQRQGVLKREDDKGKESSSQAAAAARPRKAPPESLSPILASSLGLNRIKTRSGPLPQEGFGFNRGSGLSGLSSSGGAGGDGCSTSSSASSSSASSRFLASAGRGFGKKKDTRGDGGGGGGGVRKNSQEERVLEGRSSRIKAEVRSGSRLRNGENSMELGPNAAWGHLDSVKGSDPCTPEDQTLNDAYENPKESESPRFQAILRVTSAPRRKYPNDIKSFSHELNSKGVWPFPTLKPRALNNLEEVLVAIRQKFDKAKEEVNSDLAVFAGELVGMLEKNIETHPEWQETVEDLLVLARRCAVMLPGEFWLQCESIVQELDDRRQELPMGLLKKLHTRMLFILTRCTRLLQFHKENELAEDEHDPGLRQSRILYSADKRVPLGTGEVKVSKTERTSKTTSRKFYSQEQHSLNWKKDRPVQPVNLFPTNEHEAAKDFDSSVKRNRFTSWRRLPSPVGKDQKKEMSDKDELYNSKMDSVQISKRGEIPDADLIVTKTSKDSSGQSSSPKHQHKVSWGYWGDQPNLFDKTEMKCRICEEDVLISHLEGHSRICTIADRVDQKGLSINERLIRIAETLDEMVESVSQKDSQNAIGSPDIIKVLNSSITEDSDVPSPKLGDLSRRGSEDMLECFQDNDNSVSMDDLKGLPFMTCKTRFGPKSDHGIATSSAGSMTPRSPLSTPRTSHIDLLLAGRGSFSENEDIPQIVALADIARCIANVSIEDAGSIEFLLAYMTELQEVMQRRKLDAVTVETFGARIEKLNKEKYFQFCDLVTDDKVDITSTVIDEDGPLEDDVLRSLRTSPIHNTKDRTSIDHFEIIKPISRGAFGRVFLAKKLATGDLFAIKVLRKADMIRKNAVESILAERDILISVRNPFVVRFFYSFTCQENLYLVMEYLNGGDLYSLLRNLGCLDEEVARIYIAEVVLALEYLHSEHVVHRDLKPDNLLIAHDGHIKLTDFGLSKVGLINSTDDLSGPAASGTSLFGEEEPQLSAHEHLNQRERRQQRSAVGTPDYLAPEILLGTGHGTTADWWSVGVILFELIVGLPPFNAEHPQTIFDNILNRKIPWPRVPEEMSPEAQDLIDRLLTEDPNQRLGAKGASEVKQHVFFKDINWDTLARQKAAFVPSSDSALDTSYFTSRYSWNMSDERVYAANECEDSSDSGSPSGSSCESSRQNEIGDDCGGVDELESGPSDNQYPFNNFSFKNLSQLASINYDLLTKGWKDDHP